MSRGSVDPGPWPRLDDFRRQTTHELAGDAAILGSGGDARGGDVPVRMRGHRAGLVPEMHRGLKPVGPEVVEFLEDRALGRRGRQYRQHCVRWYEADGKRRQKCFASRADAVAFRKDVESLPAREGHLVSFTLPPELAEAMNAAAKRLGCTATELVQQAVAAHVEATRKALGCASAK